MSFVTLCHASAGGGKTHTLVEFLLTYALLSPDQADQILAVTFTNKATQEMQERVMNTLNDLRKGISSPIQDNLCKRLNLSKEVLSQRAQKLFLSLLHEVDIISICTIDQLTQNLFQLIKEEESYAMEEQLLLDQNPLLIQVLEQFLSTLSETPIVEKALKKWLTLRLKQGKGWDMSSTLLDLAQVVLSQGLLHEKGLSLEQLDVFFLEKGKKNEQLESRWKELASTALEKIKKTGFTVADFAWKERGIIGFFQKNAQGKLTDPTPRIRQAAISAKAWVSSRTQYKKEVLSWVEAEGLPLLQDWLALYDHQARHYYTVRALEPLYHALCTTTRMHEMMQQKRQQEGVFFLSDTPFLLKKHLSPAQMSQLFHWQKGVWRYCLVDEFQDVSHVQWSILHPILSHMLHTQGEAFLVGDVKQAIYRWRGGDPRLFLHQVTEDIGASQIKHIHLAYNYRSAPEIILFNNLFFSYAPLLLTHTLQEEITSIAEEEQLLLLKEVNALRDAYKEHEQKVPSRHKSQEGYLHIALFPTQTKEKVAIDWVEEVLNHMIEQLEALFRSGHTPKHIGILVRNHREVQLVQEKLRSCKHDAPPDKQVYYETSSGRERWSEQGVILLLVLALRYIHTPFEGFDLTQMVDLYLKHTHNKHILAATTKHLRKEILLKDIANWLPKSFIEEATQIRYYPLPTMVQWSIRVLGLSSLSHDPLLMLFLEEISFFEQTQQGDLYHFLQWWEKEGRAKKPSLSNQRAGLTIMTIHQAKGLAFDVVFLPFVQWRLDHPPLHPPILWDKLLIQEGNPLLSIPMYYTSSLKKTLYQKRYYEEKTAAYLESLNLLYVAQTRARSMLFIFAPESNKSSITHVHDILQSWIKKESQEGNALSWRHSQTAEGMNAWECGKWQEKRSPFFSSSSNLPREASSLSFDFPKWFTCEPPLDHIGNWWHDFLSHLYRSAQLETVLDEYVVLQGLPEGMKREHIIAQMNDWWKLPLMASWFDGSWEVKTEASILLEEGKTLRLDRLMRKKEHTIVLDYKSGFPKKEDIEQVSHYHTLLERMGMPNVKSYLFYLTSATLKEVKGQ